MVCCFFTNSDLFVTSSSPAGGAIVGSFNAQSKPHCNFQKSFSADEWHHLFTFLCFMLPPTGSSSIYNLFMGFCKKIAHLTRYVCSPLLGQEPSVGNPHLEVVNRRKFDFGEDPVC